MRLLNRFLHCGGENGCGDKFEFHEEETVEDAKAYFLAHRSETNHAERVKQNHIRERLERGEAP